MGDLASIDCPLGLVALLLVASLIAGVLVTLFVSYPFGLLMIVFAGMLAMVAEQKSAIEIVFGLAVAFVLAVIGGFLFKWIDRDFRG
ncbi:hypothetical protein BKN38_08585 [Helicobacter sp. CLO-3]|uniref:hypothetical protein n=1 Tax=unclassified Helicobacter TaxID=2593540 RepID=UPI000805F58A|nr:MULTISPECIES: hypothetical protein [unclassified Helicobacter]OBV29147.1 hypothetical protein BA723_06670 [Helicobacter sp. CLO-3]OHU81630.1 hypothetical protein BKN38_08585 [Helicobacter sp. CLO-3]